MKSKITSAKIKELNKTNETAENTNIELDSSITNNNEVPESTSNITAPQIIEVTENNEICYRFPHLTFCACEINCSIKEKKLPIEVYSDIFIGDLMDACHPKILQALGVTHILNLSSTEYYKRPDLFTYLNIDVLDNIEEDIKKHFRITNRFISSVLSQKKNLKILIHSVNGFSRAPSFVIAYLIYKENYLFKTVYEQLNSICGNIKINDYFIKQLQQYENEIVKIK